ncbi:MAG TPA: YceI family protein [Candidatus Sulfotelmatobacter sp.]|nr:YceI family protein [Candidatus Sulfotelmatobacter sp.]
MKSWLRMSALTLFAAAIAASAASAATETFRIDPNHTNVGFSIRHFFSKVNGRFKDFQGAIEFDARNPAASSVDVTIQASSITTENDRRDADLRSPNFFEVDKYPTLTFKSTKVVLDADKTALNPGDHLKVEGTLSMHGVEKPVTLDVTFLGMGAVGIAGNAMGTRAGFDATATINRQDYGINWNKTLDQGGTMLGDDVTITLNIEAGSMPGPKPMEVKPSDTSKPSESPKPTGKQPAPKGGGGK